MLKEFREFAIKGDVIDLAVGVIIGGAFGKIVTSLVNDIIMPLVGLITGKVDWTNMFITLDSGQHFNTLADAKAAGVPTLNYGIFITNILDFFIVALCIFLVVRQIQKLKRKPAPAESNDKDCPYCLSKIPKKATKCAYCTADLT